MADEKVPRPISTNNPLAGAGEGIVRADGARDFFIGHGLRRADARGRARDARGRATRGDAERLRGGAAPLAPQFASHLSVLDEVLRPARRPEYRRALPLAPSVADVLARRDPVLEAILRR